MQQATIVDYRFDVLFGCPNCDYVFHYCSDIVPTEISTYHVCERCDVALMVNPVVGKASFRKATKFKKKKVKNSTTSMAKRAIKKYGFSSEEIDVAMSNVDAATMNLEDLIKKTLAMLGKKD